MTVAGVNLTAIGFFSLVSLPYSLKFLWSPFIDRFRLPFLGRRKGWLFVTQVALAATIAGMTALYGLQFSALWIFLYMFMCMCTYIFSYLSSYVLIYLSLYLFICLSVCLSIYAQ